MPCWFAWPTKMSDVLKRGDRVAIQGYALNGVTGTVIRRGWGRTWIVKLDQGRGWWKYERLHERSLRPIGEADPC